MKEQKKIEPKRKVRAAAKKQPGAKEVLPLSSTHPELCKQWCKRKNGALTPDDFSHGSHRMVWWECPVANDHIWKAQICDRARQPGCPFCTGNRVCVSNSLKTQFPEIAKQWHKKKTASFTPQR